MFTIYARIHSMNYFTILLREINNLNIDLIIGPYCYVVLSTKPTIEL